MIEYYITAEQKEKLEFAFQAKLNYSYQPQFCIAKGDIAPVIIQGQPKQIVPMRFGMPPKAASEEMQITYDVDGYRFITDESGRVANYFPQFYNLNRGTWKSMETRWAKLLAAGKKVEINIDPVFQGNSKRPSNFNVQYRVDWIEESFNNPIVALKPKKIN